MEPPPHLQQFNPVGLDKPLGPISLALAATNHRSDLAINQVDDNRPSWSHNVNMCGRMVVWIDCNPKTINAKHCGHLFSLLKPKQ
jgi:hypothetical protein